MTENKLFQTFGNNSCCEYFAIRVETESWSLHGTLQPDQWGQMGAGSRSWDM